MTTLSPQPDGTNHVDPMTGPPSLRRRVFAVVSPASLGYSSFCLESLFRASDEPLELHLITDSSNDKLRLAEAFDEIFGRFPNRDHRYFISSEDELADQEASLFAHYPNLRLFRHGHPCWRKITDPVLLTQTLSHPGPLGEEIILIDPDLYFPNRFRFEPTPPSGVLLMWQRPSCLVPPEIVRAAMEQQIRFAHHVDIGVGAWRAPVDLDWIEWLLARLDVPNLPKVMHIEAIVWAALAMRIGGGYLDPTLWRCWHRNQTKRILRILGLPGIHLLSVERFSTMKCFHAGGEAKWWLAEAKQRGLLDHQNNLCLNGPILPFQELMPSTYYREQRMKTILASLGYYSVFRT